MNNTFPNIKHHGATIGVTGSCHELLVNSQSSILVDCGIFQGKDHSSHNRADAHNLEIDFPINNVKALILTHCHIDHVGRVPWLIAAGFDKPIYCSIPTSRLLPLMLEDAAHFGITHDKRIIKKLVNHVKSLLRPLPYQEWTAVTDSLKIRLQRAGHILGSAYVECEIDDDTGSRIIFSGDLGAPHASLLPAPKSPSHCHTLVIESTYGDRLHGDREHRKQRLKDAIEHCFKNSGVILIPAFSLGRTQEVLYELEHIIHHEQPNWNDLEIIIDSPLASRITAAYRELRPFWDEEAQQVLSEHRYPLTFKQLNQIETHKEHQQIIKYLKKTSRPSIVIAASGMCNGGRITDYLTALLEDKRTDILFTGYQAKGSIGRDIQNYGPKNGWVEIQEKRYTINAGVYTISGYSAHADQQNLLDFVKGIPEPPKIIRIIHGDETAKATLTKKFSTLFPDTECLVPES